MTIHWNLAFNIETNRPTIQTDFKTFLGLKRLKNVKLVVFCKKNLKKNNKIKIMNKNRKT